MQVMRARSVGCIARAASAARIVGTVHSVHSSSAYLQCDPNLICLGANELPDGPLNIICRAGTGELGLDGISAGTPWTLNDSRLVVGDSLDVELRGAPTWHAPEFLVKPDTGSTRTLEALCVALLPHAPAISFFSVYARPRASESTELARRAREALGHLDVCLRQTGGSGSEAPAAAAIALLGLGHGLTPSGDDVLCGALVAATHFGGTISRLANAVRALAPERTNAVSTAQLLAACDGMAIAPLHDAVRGLHANQVTNLAAAARRLTRVGHTSGWDMLCGIWLASGALARGRRAMD